MIDFDFKLSPAFWIFVNDAEQIFRALKLYDGSYLVTCRTDRDNKLEVRYTESEVETALRLKDWIILKMNGVS